MRNEGCRESGCSSAKQRLPRHRMQSEQRFVVTEKGESSNEKLVGKEKESVSLSLRSLGGRHVSDRV